VNRVEIALDVRSEAARAGRLDERERAAQLLGCTCRVHGGQRARPLMAR
jgi:hypothetical protein